MPLPQKILIDLNNRFNISVERTISISGGDINEAFSIIDEKGNKYFLKYSSEVYAADMLQKEALALQLLSETQCVLIPKVFGVGSGVDFAYLLLEFIEAGRSIEESWGNFARDLAKLHQCSAENYGLSYDNYIGKLQQYNTPTSSSWIQFYADMRLTPQRNLLITGQQSPRLIGMLDVLMEKLPNIIDEDAPALVHGDLWSGNYQPDKTGRIYLIDPAISYSNREMDIAMSMLFGGFPPTFYKTYDEYFPLINGWQSRVGIYQLYYLLVHVNLFGGSYIESAKRIMQKYI